VTEETTVLASWAILELMGHRRLAGFVSEQQIAGAGFLRLDIPDVNPVAANMWAATQFYAPSSVYAITPCTEETARLVAEGATPGPVTAWEVPRLPAVAVDDHPARHSLAPGATLWPSGDRPPVECPEGGREDRCCTLSHTWPLCQVARDVLDDLPF